MGYTFIGYKLRDVSWRLIVCSSLMIRCYLVRLIRLMFFVLFIVGTTHHKHVGNIYT